MTGLINKVDKLIKEDVSVVQAVVDKYIDILKVIQSEKEIPYLAYIIDACVNHIDENHSTISADWKSWSVLVVRHFYDHKKVKVESDIPPIIDEFLEYKEKGYDKYRAKMVSATDYDMDRGFMYTFINKKIGK